jgi:hypothetical protein
LGFDLNERLLGSMVLIKAAAAGLPISDYAYVIAEGRTFTEGVRTNRPHAPVTGELSEGADPTPPCECSL